MIAVGMMSGTSGDGINLAAIEVEPGDHPSVRILATGEEKYPDAIRDAVLRAGADEPFLLSDVARLHGQLGDAYAAAAVAFIASLPKRPDVIALHGQTVSHLPAEHTTFQIGDASRVARATGLPTVSDFRSADMAAGGEGAPLVPFSDHVLFGSRAPIAEAMEASSSRVCLWSRRIAAPISSPVMSCTYHCSPPTRCCNVPYSDPYVPRA